MAKAIQAYEGGIHGLIQLAVRADGTLFRRFQDKGRYEHNNPGASAPSEREDD